MPKVLKCASSIPVAVGKGTLPETSARILEVTRQLEHEWRQLEQVDLETHHVLHAGIYSRTILLPKGVAITGALIKIPTVLTVVGDLVMTCGDEVLRVKDFAVWACAPGRKQVMLAERDCVVTMSFATKAKTVQEAEDEFTDEAANLMSRREK